MTGSVGGVQNWEGAGEDLITVGQGASSGSPVFRHVIEGASCVQEHTHRLASWKMILLSAVAKVPKPKNFDDFKMMR